MFWDSGHPEIRRIYPQLRSLDFERDRWILRSVVSVDLSSGQDTCIERVTYDLDPRLLRATTVAGSVYVPLFWRNRETFLEFDCKTNSGTSFQLIPLNERIDYCEWLFWELCKEAGYSSDVRRAPKNVYALMRKHITEGRYDDRDFLDQPLSVQRFFNRILEDPRVCDFYSRIGRDQPVILKVSAGEDLSLIKVSQRKVLLRPERRLSDVLDGAFVASIVCSSSSISKFRAPEDSRLDRVVGYMYNPATGEFDFHNPIKGDIHGGGSWACSPTKTYSGSVYWLLRFTPRRAYFVASAARTAFVAMLAAFYWIIADFNISDIGAATGSFSLATVTAFFVYQLRLFSIFSERSIEFRWALRCQRYLLMALMVGCLFIPLMANFADRIKYVAAVIIRDIPILELPLLGAHRFISSITMGSPVYAARVAFFLIFIAIWANLVHVYKMGDPTPS